MRRFIGFGALCLFAGVVGCESDDGNGSGGEEEVDLHSFASGCYTVHAGDQVLARSGDSYGFTSDAGKATNFRMRASDLGTYLLYDEEGGFVTSDGGGLERKTSLESDVTTIDSKFVSEAEWLLEAHNKRKSSYQLRSRRTEAVMGLDGTSDDETEAASVTFEQADDGACAVFPELTLDASGTIEKTTFDDGDLYGIVDTHSHIFSNVGFGGGGVFHGAPYHRLGVEHALSDCSLYHGPMGRKDFFGYAFDSAGADGADLTSLLPALLKGSLDFDVHETAGYPDFTEWPNAPTRSTHQTQYYKWLERAHMAGLRLVIQHATTNSVICHMTAGSGIQEVRHSCEDMVNVDRIIDDVYAMERYIDAQAGGPGKGFFRIVKTPAEAREIIAEGKMAVVLGIETSDLFHCRMSPRGEEVTCNEAYVKEQLDAYYERGVRAIFPVHKYDNAFSAGDGDRAFIELGNFLNSGNWANFVLDCPADVPSVFDKGDVAFGGLNMPRDEYMSTPPNDVSNLPRDPLGTAFPYLSYIEDPPLVGDYCQKTGLTPLGETLIGEMMKRGMIIEIDHLPRRSYERAFELLEDADYPAAGTHGTNWDGRLYELGGVSKTGLGRCRESGRKGAMLDRLTERVDLLKASGAYPAEGFGFDLNGFAGAPKARFADGACGEPQTDPVTYPFTSFAGDVEFTQPKIGNRELNFNDEGLVHIGLLPELLQDARGDAASDEDLEPLFRSAEGYIRMWEKAEARSAALGG